MVGVVQDPWSKNPRVFLSSLDGKPVSAPYHLIHIPSLISLSLVTEQRGPP